MRLAEGEIELCVRALADLVLPRRCGVCGAVLDLRERHICTQCLADLPLTHFWTTPRNEMADKFNGMIQRDLVATEPMPRESYSYASALFFYNSESPYKLLTQQLKYYRRFSLGRYLSGMLGRRLAGAGEFADVDLVVAVPLHWTRRWSRGYNQSEVIARELGAALGAPVRTDVLKRRRRTRTQVRVGTAQKSANVSGAFALAGRHNLERYRHILLVDDTFTTGATLNECRKALRGAFGGRISVATLAFVRRSG